MAGNKYKHGKGWPDYGSKVQKGQAASYSPRKRGPAQTPKRETTEAEAVSVE